MSYAVVAVMSVLAAWVASVVVGVAVPTWHAGAYLLGATITVLLTVMGRAAITRERPGAATRAALRTREALLVIVLVLPAALILPYLPGQPVGLTDMVVHIWTHPTAYVNVGTLITTGMLVGAWAFPVRPLDTLERLMLRVEDGSPVGPPKDYTGYADELVRLVQLPGLGIAQRQLSTWSLASLVGLAVALAFVWRVLPAGTRLLTEAAIIGYATMALTLIALGAFERHRSRWLLEGIEVEGETANRWASSSGAITAALACLALLAPTVILMTLTRALLAGLLLGLLGLLHLMFHLPMPKATPATGSLLPMLGKLPAQTRPAVHQAALPDWLIPIAVAVAFLLSGLLLLVLVAQWRRSAGAPRLPWRETITAILGAFRELAKVLRHWVAGLRFVTVDLLERAGQAPITLVARIGRRMPPKDDGAAQVRYWYGRALSQAIQRGFRRQAGQTAWEYRAAVHDQVIAAGPSLDALTAAYVTARYSGRPIPLAQGDAMRRQFLQFRRVLPGGHHHRFLLGALADGGDQHQTGLHVAVTAHQGLKDAAGQISTEVSASPGHCPHCGATSALDTVYCAVCGQRLPSSVGSAYRPKWTKPHLVDAVFLFFFGAVALRALAIGTAISVLDVIIALAPAGVYLAGFAICALRGVVADRRVITAVAVATLIGTYMLLISRGGGA